MTTAGRYAPSPTSDLHLGNLRTAVVAWLLARATGREFRWRIEDLDAARVAAAPGADRRQLADLAALGIDQDGPVLRQSERSAVYAAAAAQLPTYECYCTRREIAQAVSAPHAGDGPRTYPGTCRDLSDAERARRRRERPPALRLRADGATATAHDRWHGDVAGVVDDVVLRRNDGAWAYQLAVVVDDGLSGVDQVCRGDDLLDSAPSQAWLAARLGLVVPEYAHVGLVTNEAGQRLAKRDGAVTLADLARLGVDALEVLGWIAASLGLDVGPRPAGAAALLARFDPDRVPVGPVVSPPWPARR